LFLGDPAAGYTRRIFRFLKTEWKDVGPIQEFMLQDIKKLNKSLVLAIWDKGGLVYGETQQTKSLVCRGKVV
jgi:hypothetical protein